MQLYNDYKMKREAFYEDTIKRLEVDVTFWWLLAFSDEATVYLSGNVRKNVRIWGDEQSHDTEQVFRNSSKANMFWAVSKTKAYGFFLLAEATFR
jgi:hypothetical protein